MKKLFTVMILKSLITGVVAQAPNRISFQAVVRDNSNQLIVNSQVGMKTTILQGSPAGTVVYEELHFPNPQTNANGLVTLKIGSGLVIQGSFSNIQLGMGPYYIKTDTDPTGGTNYTISGTSQFLSVPYALYANEANPVGPAGGDLAGTYPNPIIANSAVTNTKIANSAVTASKIGSNAVTTVKIEDGAVTQAKIGPGVSLPPSGAAGGDLSGTYPNPVVSRIQGRPVVSTLPIAGQALKWTGSTWAPQPDGLSLPYTGSTSSGTSAMSVTHNAASGENYAGYFTNSSTSGTGVFGIATSSDGTTYGVRGHSNSSEGYSGYFTGMPGSRNFFQQPVGIGTFTPNYALEAFGIIAATEVGIRDFVGGADPLASIRAGSAGGGTFGTMELFVKNAGTPFRYLHISATGNVSIGTNYTGSYKLHLQENSAAKPVSSSWTVPSDQRLKEDIRPFSDGLELVKQINPVWFTYTGEARMPQLSGVGLLAQELQKLAPYMVRPYQHVVQEASEDQQEVATEYLAIDFGAMDFLLINAIQEQQSIIEAQNERIRSLEQTVIEMRQMMLTNGIKAKE